MHDRTRTRRTAFEERTFFGASLYIARHIQMGASSSSSSVDDDYDPSDHEIIIKLQNARVYVDPYLKRYGNREFLCRWSNLASYSALDTAPEIIAKLALWDQWIHFNPCDTDSSMHTAEQTQVHWDYANTMLWQMRRQGQSSTTRLSTHGLRTHKNLRDNAEFLKCLREDKHRRGASSGNPVERYTAIVGDIARRMIRDSKKQIKESATECLQQLAAAPDRYEVATFLETKLFPSTSAWEWVQSIAVTPSRNKFMRAAAAVAALRSVDRSAMPQGVMGSCFERWKRAEVDVSVFGSSMFPVFERYQFTTEQLTQEGELFWQLRDLDLDALQGIVCFASSGAAGSSRFDEPKLFAIGDVHGDLAVAVACLVRCCRVMDPNDGRWIGGNATVVFCGDLIDRYRPGAVMHDDKETPKRTQYERADEEREILTLILCLQRQAKVVGGQVIVLAGNHDVAALCSSSQTGIDPNFVNTYATEYRKKKDEKLYTGRERRFRPGGDMNSLYRLVQTQGIYSDRRAGSDWVMLHGGLPRETNLLIEPPPRRDGTLDLPAYVKTVNEEIRRAIYEGVVNDHANITRESSNMNPLWSRRWGSRETCCDSNDCEEFKKLVSLSPAHMVVAHCVDSSIDEELFFPNVAQRLKPQTPVPRWTRSEDGSLVRENVPSDIRHLLRGISVDCGAETRIVRCDMGMSRAFDLRRFLWTYDEYVRSGYINRSIDERQFDRLIRASMTSRRPQVLRISPSTLFEGSAEGRVIVSPYDLPRKHVPASYSENGYIADPELTDENLDNLMKCMQKFIHHIWRRGDLSSFYQN